MKMYEIEKSEAAIMKDQYEVEFRKLTNERNVADKRFKNELKLSAEYKYRMVRAEERLVELEHYNELYQKDIQDLKQYRDTQNIQITSQQKEIIQMRNMKEELIQEAIKKQLEAEQSKFNDVLSDAIYRK